MNIFQKRSEYQVNTQLAKDIAEALGYTTDVIIINNETMPIGSLPMGIYKVLQVLQVMDTHEFDMLRAANRKAFALLVIAIERELNGFDGIAKRLVADYNALTDSHTEQEITEMDDDERQRRAKLKAFS